ncbi:MAG: DUF1016 domain-containing protein, partial [Chthoniobacterales bacterium]|nr:DUF1016 domain-containing protein [Chthoniobacterales bacterium]
MSARRPIVKPKSVSLSGYARWFSDLKTRIRTAQLKAALAVNAELILLYWQMGERIAAMQAKEG